MKRGIVYAGMAGAVWGLVFLVPKLLPEFSPLLLSCGRFIVYGAVSLALADTGRTTLTLYVAHALVFNLVVDWLGWVHPGGLSTSLLFAFCFWCVAVMFATLLHQRFRNGPLESAYRWFS